jgi:membrane-bound serine protease (ClpP class)
MSYGESAILLFAVGIILLIAELFLPAHGMILLLGMLAILTGIGLCFVINPWLGLGAFVGSAAGMPLLFALLIWLMPRTPMGRKFVLPPIPTSVPPIAVQIGQTGTAVSELRPMGLCEFDDHRVQAASELGVIAAGKKVQVVSLNNRQPTVRAL